MKTINRSRSSLMTSLMVIGSLAGLYVFQRRRGENPRRIFNRAKDAVNRQLGQRSERRPEVEQRSPVDSVDLDRTPAI